MTKSKTTEALEGTGRFLDDRLRAARAIRGALRKLYPDHWTFLLGEIALYSFVILLLTGTFLTFFFQPSMTEIVYHGAYMPLRGVRMISGSGGVPGAVSACNADWVRSRLPCVA